MPTKPPHQVPSQESQNPHPPRSVGAYYTKRPQSLHGPHPNCAKRTQLQPRRTCGNPKNAKRTQSTVRARHAVPHLRETNPISTPATPRLCKTNPISTPTAPKMQNEPNYRMPSVPPPPIIRNEPNLPSRQFHTATFSAKRTQFQPQRTCGGSLGNLGR